jgi:hypothetical protein
MKGPVATPVSTPRRRLVWRITGGMLLLGLLALLLAAAAIVHALGASPVQVIFNGEPIAAPQSLTDLSLGQWSAFVGGIALVLLALSVLVPVALLIGLGLPLLIAALVMALLTSPLLLIGWLLWRLLRPARTISA